MKISKRAVQKVLARHREMVAAINTLQPAPKHAEIGRLLDPKIDTGDTGVSFVPIFRNAKDQSLLYIVPADQFGLCGTSDTLAKDSLPRSAPWSLRCGRGLWVSEKSIMKLFRISELVLDEEGVARALELLEALFCGGSPRIHQGQIEADADPELEQWLEDVTRIMCIIQQQIEAIELEEAEGGD